MKGKNLGLIEGNIKIGILSFAFPIFLGELFQQLYNVVDAIVVGNYVGEKALAAVTSTGVMIFLVVGFFAGVFSGVSVVISRYFGAKDDYLLKRSVGTATYFGIIVGIILTFVGYFFSPLILRIMGTPNDVFNESLLYIRTYFLGSIFTVLYNTSCGVFRAVGDSRHPLYYLCIAAILNVFLDIIFVKNFNMGVSGAALATVISQGISAFLALFRLFRVNEVYRLNFKEFYFDREIMKEMICIGFPSGIQNSVIAISNVVIQSGINSFGSAAMAGNGAYLKLEGFAFIPVSAFSSAMSTFVSQNIGAKKCERVKKGIRFGVLFSLIVAQFIGFFILIFGEDLIRIFGDGKEAIEVGVKRANINSWFFFLVSFSHCIAGALRGAGKSKVPMFTMLICWCLIRVPYIKIITSVSRNISYVFWAYPITWTLSTIVFIIYYKKSNWLGECENKIESEEYEKERL